MAYAKPAGSDCPLRAEIRRNYLADESTIVKELLRQIVTSESLEANIHSAARKQVEKMRAVSQSPSLIDSFLQEFTLSSEEGIVLMCLAEALLRIPDAHTADALIKDKLSSGDWGAHLGHSESLLVNASTWGLLLTGKWVTMDDQTHSDPFAFIKHLVSKSGEPAIRLAVRQAMKIMGQEFVLAECIETALLKSKQQLNKSFTYSYDMLGEAAQTDSDAQKYTAAYAYAIEALGRAATSDNPAENPGISIKLSALHARYEFAQIEKTEQELYPRLLNLALKAKQAQLGFNIDAEEADRLELSLSLFEKLALEPALKGWDGLGFVVQAYLKRAVNVLDWLIDLSARSEHRFMLRLVKGAYWDSEIKLAQIQGLAGYPVFTRKENTDLSYLVCAQKLLANRDAFYPQFATHNAHTVASVMAYAPAQADFEFQCLHGMGERLYARLVPGHRCRIYAPVGEHKRLLAYLVRRLLENGANTSFVNLLANKNQEIDRVIANPLSNIRQRDAHRHPGIVLPKDLYAASRTNSQGLNLADSDSLDAYYAYFLHIQNQKYKAKPLLGRQIPSDAETWEIKNPMAANQVVGEVQLSSDKQVDIATGLAQKAFVAWDDLGGEARADILQRAADLFEHHRFELIALCQLEAGKTLADAVSEFREAVDFLRFYAVQARHDFKGFRQLQGPTGEKNEYGFRARGVFVCISPWNFPLAIFCGQVSAALLAGNAVLAKPAEQTPLIAWRAVSLMHEAGVPRDVLQYLPGEGHRVGEKLCQDSRVDGVVFTGGTDTARRIHQSLSSRPNTALPLLIAETGGLNAMIVDSSALAEQVVKDVIESAFQSAGQRCSALRVLYLQEDIADELLKMIKGGMAELITGDQIRFSTDVGPIIDEAARASLEAHIAHFEGLNVTTRAPRAQCEGNFFEPALIEISGMAELEKEIFGPVLHVVRFKSKQLEHLVDDINASGYGLTLGIHSRINSNIQKIVARARVGNVYINRNMIGAVVGTQPFGGEGLSGTGPKAGGPQYLRRFAVERVISTDTTAAGGNASLLTLDS